MGQLRVSEAVLREISVWEALNTRIADSSTKVFYIFTSEAYFLKNKYRYEIMQREKTKYRLWKFEDG